MSDPGQTRYDEQGRPEPPLGADEIGTLWGYVEFLRATFAWKCSGLDDAGLKATVGRSSMTLGGMLKHLALVEDTWCTYRIGHADLPEPWASADWDADPDWDWHSAADDSPEELVMLWSAAVERSRVVVQAALEAGSHPDVLALRPRRTWADGRSPSYRWILTHLIEEYGRHCGHADLIREAYDGQAGE